MGLKNFMDHFGASKQEIDYILENLATQETERIDQRGSIISGRSKSPISQRINIVNSP